MSRIMQQTIRSEDYYTLQHIVQEADIKYLKQSRINKLPFSSNLNILRVLSAFKELFPSTPQRIYKLLMMITKNHNPQTKDQWIRAIDKLQCIQLKKATILNSFIQQDSDLRTRSYSQIHKLKNSNYENSIKTYKQELDHQIDSIVSKRSRAKFVGDFRTTEPFFDAHDENKENNMLLSNKNSLRNSHIAHYISFQPYQRDSIKQCSQLPQYLPLQIGNTTKQNHQMIKKINPYHEITRIDNLSRIQDQEPSSKDDSKTLYSQNYRTEQNSYRCIPTKTQRDFSQTRFIGLDSKDSEISIKKSHIVRNQKFQETSQYEFYNMTIDQWQNLNQKASTFYSFNLKLKAFSAVLANYQAFQYDKFLKDKAKIFNSSYLQSKVFIALKANISFQQLIKEKFKKAQKFYNQNQYKKVWKVIQLMRNLKIQKQKKVFKIQKLKVTNYEFFMTFMFAQKSNFQDSTNKNIDQNSKQQFQLGKKVEYFSRTQNFDNVWEIYKCFGLNINISKQKLAQFFKKYHRCILKQSFLTFKKYHQTQKQKYLKLHQKRLIQKVFSILLSKQQLSQDLKAKLKKAQLHANKKLKQKTYKILLSVVYSTKIFSKRQEFVESQKLNRTKLNIFNKWFSSYQSNQSHRKLQQTQLSKMYKVIQQFILKKSLQNLKLQSIRIENKTIELSNIIKKSGQQSFLIKLKKIFFQKKNFQKICSISQIHLQKNFLKKWFRLIKFQQSLIKIQKSYKKIIFRNLFVPITQDIKQDYLLNLQAQKNLIKQCFENWKQEKENHQKKLKNLQIQLDVQHFHQDCKSFLNLLKNNRKENLIIRGKQELSTKQEIVQNDLISENRKQFFKQFKTFVSEKLSLKDKIRILNANLKRNYFIHMLNKSSQQKLLSQNYRKLQSHLKSQNFRNLCIQLSRNKLEITEKTITLKVQRNKLTNFLAKVSQKCKQLNNLSQKSQTHFKNITQRKVLLIMANLIIQSTEKSHQIQKFLNKQRRGEYFEVFKQKALITLMQKKKSKIVQKRQLFVSLRENRNLKNKKKSLQTNLVKSKIKKTFQSIIQNVEFNIQATNINQKTDQLKKKKFWIRFNEYFIDSLFQKKHSFMAYKFRALKLYGIAFKQWRKSTQGLNDKKNISKQTKSREKQKFFNHTQKQFKHMYRPTDCSILSK